MALTYLLILASGKSTRFGGFPKAFCQLGNIYNVDNTIKNAKKYFDQIFLGVNKQTYDQFNHKIKGCDIFPIIMGQGDAHSLLKCLNYIISISKPPENIVVCWGDAIFLNDLPFKELIQNKGFEKVAVACSIDKRPYAWFDTDTKNNIVKAHFAKIDGEIERALHDQSLFMFDFEFAIQYLDSYRKFLKIKNNNDESLCDKNEMKLLYSFEYLKKAGYEPARCVMISPGNVYSFNTKEELETIKNIVKFNHFL